MEELLKILDMTEEEQFVWVCANLIDDWPYQQFCKEHLADLAFRLRDEVYLDDRYTPILRKCMQTVTAKADPFFADDELWETWWIASAQPIHWIIAALIAKEKEDAE